MRAIIFDLLGVIIDEENIASKKLYNFLNNPSISSDYIKERYADGLKIGKLSHKDFWSTLTTLNWQEAEMSFLKTLSVFNDAYDTLSDLKKEYMIGSISEIPSLWAEGILKNYSIYNFFDTLVLSDEFGTTKGNDDMFKAIRNRIDCDYKDMIYIDDKVKNLSIPKHLGMTTVWFKRKEQDLVENPDGIVSSLSEFSEFIKSSF